MKNFIIFLSKYDEFLNSALKMKREFNCNVQILYIEDFYRLRYDKMISEDNILYFLCNGEMVTEIVNILRNKKCYIFNKEYLLTNYKKYDVQCILKNNFIPVPKIYSADDSQNIKFPLFCKENKHAGITFQAYNKNTLREFFGKFEKSNFYYEEAVNANGIKSKEFKIYYIAGKVFEKNSEKNITKGVVDLAKKIATSLKNIEVFSADIIKNNRRIYVIDVNPASGFYLSDAGRNAFKKYISENIISENGR